MFLLVRAVYTRPCTATAESSIVLLAVRKSRMLEPVAFDKYCRFFTSAFTKKNLNTGWDVWEILGDFGILLPGGPLRHALPIVLL